MQNFTNRVLPTQREYQRRLVENGNVHIPATNESYGINGVRNLIHI